ncbi:cyclin-dependent protein kinase inhibitor SMR2 [Salvia hispanica]|uniref:cyclin-dependent protein kinase inhibitor SMR2 n=1 Tax=Salvia hispanica TaxID=49212 RepID=UPI002009328D|nr:cyclin-dependent protein kinase inhibitor SMR2 [Salvia hispanica]
MSADLEIRAVPITKAAAAPPISQDSDKISECCTPKSAEHRIPAVVSCPPAPRKPRRGSLLACKRRLYELDFYEAVAEDKIESFFRRAEVKRRCVV